MATVDSAEMIRGMLKNNGIYRDESGEDPAPYAIAQYTNQFGKPAWSICYNQPAFNSLCNSPYCTEILVFWMQETGLSGAGREFLEKEGE